MLPQSPRLMPTRPTRSMQSRWAPALRGFLIAILVAIACEAAICTQSDPNQLLQLAIDRVKSNTRALSRLTCEEHTSRRFYLTSAKDVRRKGQAVDRDQAGLPLPALLTAAFEGRDLLWSDRLRVELSLFNGKDIFTWPGGGAFDSDLDSLINNGPTLSGVLGPFDISVLLNDAEPRLFRYERTVTALGTTFAEYKYKVPVEKSHLQVPDASGARAPISYEGFFLVDTATGDLRRLCVELNSFPHNAQLSQGAVVTDYDSHNIANTVAFVPISSTMRLSFKQGALAVNDMRYTDCHEFQAESTVTYNNATEDKSSDTQASISEKLPPIARNRLLKLALNTPIDSDTAATGDLVQAHVMKPLKGKDGRILIPAGAIVRGRIVRLVEYAAPYNSIELVMKFNELELGRSLVPIRLLQKATESQEGPQGPHFAVGRGRPVMPAGQAPAPTAQDDRKHGTGTFEFDHTNHVHLSAGYQTEWLVD
jgi:hypothetical protein